MRRVGQARFSVSVSVSVSVQGLLGVALGVLACRTGGTAAAPAAPPPTLGTSSLAARVPMPPAAPPIPAPPVLLSPADLDRMVVALWESARVLPAARADDSEFLRRVTLDVAGRIPTLDEAEKFLADPTPDKRGRLVEQLLASPDYAGHFADIYLDLFVGRQFRKPKLEKQLDPRAYFVRAFRENRGFDQLAREMLTFTGEILPNGPGVFLASHLKGGGPEMAASVTARLFLGVQIQCAQCHDHPYDDRYKQEDFYGLVAFFARTKDRQQKRPGDRPDPADAKVPNQSQESGTGEPEMAAGVAPNRTLDVGAPDGKVYSIVDKKGGKASFKKAGADKDTIVRPRFFGRQVSPLPGEALRQTLARAVVDSDLFAKTMVDRTWAQLFGRGIVDPWDDLGGEKDPRHPPLLNALAEDFRVSGFDIKHLLRTLLRSRAYGLTSRAPALATVITTDAADAGAVLATVVSTDAGAALGNVVSTDAADAGAPPAPVMDPTASFARASVRRLTPEQLFRSLLLATGADHMEGAAPAEMEKKIDRLLREYLFVFGDDEMAEINTFNGNVPQALLMWNGEIVNQGARSRPGGTLARILEGFPDVQTRLGKMFLVAYARPPTVAEQARFLPALLTEKGGRAAYEDLFFALLTSAEMLTIH